MSLDTLGTLHELGDTELTVADPDADVRGRIVVDGDDRVIGRVDDLVIDGEGRHVRFLRVAEGGFLGFLATHFLVPVEAVVAVHPARVRVDGRLDADGVPGYDPELAVLPPDHGHVYGWWGVAPCWRAPLR